MVLFYLFLFAAVIQVGYALLLFIRVFSLPAAATPVSVQERLPVSIIICAKNEAANLRKNLPLILAQRYSNDAGIPLYEVIVVNDASTDDTEEVLKELEQHYDNLWDVIIPSDAVRNMPGKKFALSKGIAYATHQWLLLTDADCSPASDNWLELMVTPRANGKEIVAGYGGFHRSPGLLNAFIRWETLHTFLQYSTYLQAGKPYMAVGRNMACTKDALLKAQASRTWTATPSGDDDLLVSVSGTQNNMAIVADKDAFTVSHTPSSFADWIKQKQRHLSTGKYYKPGIKTLLAVYGCSHAVLWLSFFSLLIMHYCYLAILVMAIRCFLFWTLWAVTAGKLREKTLIFLFPFFDIAWMLYNFAFFPYITWKNKQHWK